MKKQFNIIFDSPELRRKYGFDLNFTTEENYEQALDWAERTNYILDFLEIINQKYGYHEVSYDPDVEFLAFETYNVLPRHYIRVMNLWFNFFKMNEFECDDILELPIK